MRARLADHRREPTMPDMNPTWRETRALIAADIRRRLLLEGRRATLANLIRLAVMPGMVCVFAYRMSSFFYGRNHRLLAHLIDDIQYLYTGIELHMGSSVGPGLVVGDRPGGGFSEHVTIGKNCTLLGGAMMTLSGDGVDLTKGRVTLGDYCIIGVNVRIIGGVKLADGTQIKPNAVVLKSAPIPGTILAGMPARRVSVVPIEEVVCWNPVRSISMSHLATERASTAERAHP